MSNCNIKVLLADDDEINRLIIQRILTEDRGFDLTVATDGKSALMVCLTRAFDLLIVDYKMPDIPGDRLIRHIRSSVNPNTGARIALFSAATREELAPVLEFCDVDAVISKPITAAGLLQSVAEMLNPDSGAAPS